VKAAVVAHYQNVHGSIGETFPASYHTDGLCFDATISLATGNIDRMARCCGLERVLLPKEPWHFKYTGVTCRDRDPDGGH
jgi:hypothetical protein